MKEHILLWAKIRLKNEFQEKSKKRQHKNIFFLFSKSILFYFFSFQNKILGGKLGHPGAASLFFTTTFLFKSELMAAKTTLIRNNNFSYQPTCSVFCWVSINLFSTVSRRTETESSRWNVAWRGKAALLELRRVAFTVMWRTRTVWVRGFAVTLHYFAGAGAQVLTTNIGIHI